MLGLIGSKRAPSKPNMIENDFALGTWMGDSVEWLLDLDPGQVQRGSTHAVLRAVLGRALGKHRVNEVPI